MRVPILNRNSLLYFCLFYISSITGTLVYNLNNGISFASFSAVNNPVNGNENRLPSSIIVVTPNIQNSDCQPDMSSIPKFNTSINVKGTAVMILRTPSCNSVLKPLNYWGDMVTKLQLNLYPNVTNVIWAAREFDRVILGAPGSELDSFSPAVTDTINYQIVSDVSFERFISNNPNSVFTLYNEANPWSLSQMSFNVLSWKSALQAVKLVLFFISIVAFGCVASRSRLKGKLQLSLLFSSLLLLGGDLIFSWCNVSDIRFQLYQLFLLLPCLFTNVFAVLSWTTIVLRLKLIPIKTFRFGIILESIMLTVCLFVLIAWLYLDRYQSGSISSWYTTGLYVILGFLVGIPLSIIVWFISKAHNFCPLFFTIARLINGQRLTMYILMTRIIFVLLLISTFLVVFFVKSYNDWVSFTLFNNISLIFYSIMILLTVNKFQSIHTASSVVNSLNESHTEDITMQPTHDSFMVEKLTSDPFSIHGDQMPPQPSAHSQSTQTSGPDTPDENACRALFMGNNNISNGIHF